MPASCSSSDRGIDARGETKVVCVDNQALHLSECINLSIVAFAFAQSRLAIAVATTGIGRNALH